MLVWGHGAAVAPPAHPLHTTHLVSKDICDGGAGRVGGALVPDGTREVRGWTIVPKT